MEHHTHHTQKPQYVIQQFRIETHAAAAAGESLAMMDTSEHTHVYIYYIL
jgi:hypothetical protein